MTSNQRIYPEAVENTLDVILESVVGMEFEAPMDFNVLRDVIGECLFEHWLSGGDDIPLDEDGVLKLLNRASAITIVQQMKERGWIDSIDDGTGEEIVFLTQKGKQVYERNTNCLTNLIMN
jgi:hypothetical protein